MKKLNFLFLQVVAVVLFTVCIALLFINVLKVFLKIAERFPLENIATVAAGLVAAAVLTFARIKLTKK